MAQKPEQIGQDEIDKLLRSDATAAPAATPPGASGHAQGKPPKGDAPAGGATKTEPLAAARGADRAPAMATGDVEYLLKQAQEALASVDTPRETAPGVSAFRFEEFGGAPATTEAATLDLIRDVELDVRIELGRTQMYLDDVLRLRRGSVVALDKLAGDPVDIYVNGRLVARGEVLVLNENFCVRVNELVAAQPARAG
jgi:flagellar motor switch protein FliN/FliY